MYSKQVIMALTIVFVIGVAASSGQEVNTWQDIKNTMTEVLRNLGLPRAGQPCVNVGRDYNRCIAENDGSLEEIPFLECDQVVGIDGLLGAGVCNVKSWIVFLVLLIIAAIPISILSCLCCFCCRCR